MTFSPSVAQNAWTPWMSAGQLHGAWPAHDAGTATQLAGAAGGPGMHDIPGKQ
jgi:hypothetical protein